MRSFGFLIGLSFALLWPQASTTGALLGQTPARSSEPLESRRWESTGGTPAALIPIRSPERSPGRLADFLIQTGQEPALNPPGVTPLQSPATEPLPSPESQPSAAGDSGQETEPPTNQPSSDILPPGDHRSQRPIETSGRIERIRQHYPDGKVQVEREVTQDLEGNYMNHGDWRLFGPAGQSLAEGLFQYGLMEGPWSRWHPAEPAGIFTLKPFHLFRGPFLSTATFREGQLDGVWTISDANQRKIMEMSYRAGKRHGLSAWYYPNSARMREQYYVDGWLEGPLVEWDDRGRETRREEYQRGRRVAAERQLYRPNQPRSEVFFLDARLQLAGNDDWWEAKPAAYQSSGEKVQHGPCNTWYENGQPQMQGQFTEGQKTGSWTWWHPNGQKQLAGQFEADEKTGPWIWWHPNGLKAVEGHYEHDQPAGIWMWWDENGQQTDRQNFLLDGPQTDEPEIIEPEIDKVADRFSNTN